MWDEIRQFLFGISGRILLTWVVYVVVVTILNVLLYPKHRNVLICMSMVGEGVILVLSALSISQSLGWVSFGPDVSGTSIWLALLLLLQAVWMLRRDWKELRSLQEK